MPKILDICDKVIEHSFLFVAPSFLLASMIVGGAAWRQPQTDTFVAEAGCPQGAAAVVVPDRSGNVLTTETDGTSYIRLACKAGEQMLGLTRLRKSAVVEPQPGMSGYGITVSYEYVASKADAIAGMVPSVAIQEADMGLPGQRIAVAIPRQTGFDLQVAIR